MLIGMVLQSPEEVKCVLHEFKLVNSSPEVFTVLQPEPQCQDIIQQPWVDYSWGSHLKAVEHEFQCLLQEHQIMVLWGAVDTPTNI